MDLRNLRFVLHSENSPRKVWWSVFFRRRSAERLLSSLSPTVCIAELENRWTDFHEIPYMGIYGELFSYLFFFFRSDMFNDEFN
jgi:hypothetical protein